MPFSITLTIDGDKLDPGSSRAGDLRVNYYAPREIPGQESGPNLGGWNHQGRYEAANEGEMIADVCAKFEAWRDKRLVELEIEGRLMAAIEPLCPCHEPPQEEDEEPEEPEGEPE